LRPRRALTPSHTLQLYIGVTMTNREDSLPLRPYKGRLLRPSIPESPGWPSRRNIDQWRREKTSREHEGVRLLLEHYGIGKSALQSERDKLFDLVVALACNHRVPFFRSRTSRRSIWDGFLLAQLLQVYQARIKAGCTPEEARAAARRRLPGKLADASDKTIKNQLATARRAFRTIVRTTPDGLLEPVGESGARWWQSMLNGPNPQPGDENITFGPSPYDQDNVLVSGLPPVPE
jgi:hypothetical protein